MKNILFLAFLIICNITFSQSKLIKGKITNELDDGLANVTIFATSKTQPIKYTISDSLGMYKLKLKDSTYNVSYSHIGYLTVNKKINELLKSGNIALKQNESVLDEIVIKQDIRPVVVKKDTIIFNAEDFSRMSDRKLRDLLDHIPALEVTNEGDVYFQGEKVKKLLVEGKKFFNDGTKLAVNNLPSDAVKKIELLEDYKNSTVLSDVTENKTVAINIKLKEDKKKLLFGNIDGAIGNKNFYDVYSSLFYYSPVNSVASISRMNNIGSSSSFTNDYFDSGSGIESELFYENIINYSHKFSNQNLAKTKRGYTGLNYNRTKKDNKSSLYFLLSKDESLYQSTGVNSYFNSPELNEERQVEYLNDKKTLTSSYTYNKKPKDNAFNVLVNLAFSANFNDSNNNTLSSSNNEELSFNERNDIENYNFFSSVELHKKSKKNNKFAIGLMASMNKDSKNNFYNSNQLILEDFIPVQNSNYYNFVFNDFVKQNELSFQCNYYWLINNANQLHFLLNSKTATNSLQSDSFQDLGENDGISFDEIDNNIDFNNFSNSFDINYKYRGAKSVFNLMLNNVLVNSTLNEINVDSNKYQYHFLPAISYQYNFTKTKEMNFLLNRSFNLPSLQLVNNKLSIESFNYAYRGNSDLKDEIKSRFSVSLKNYNVFRGLFYNASSSILYHENRNELSNTNSGIDIISQYKNDSFGDFDFSNNASVGKIFDKFTIKFTTNLFLGHNYNILNDDKILYKQLTWNNTLEFKSDFTKTINFNLKLKNQISESTINGAIDKFNLSSVTLKLEKTFKDRLSFDFSTNYQVPNAFNKTKTYLIGDVNLKYLTPKSRFTYGISALNIFNYQTLYSFRNYQLGTSINTINILPRRLLFYLSFSL